MARAAFYDQPARHRFGQILIEELREPHWLVVDIAVAWVRHAGARQLRSALRKFLRRGGILRITVGIDIENTSREGLAELLKLRHGDVGVFVYHNEAQAVTFHPKVYLFSSATEAKLIVGSSNLTEGGLSTNTEAALEVEATLRHKAVQAAQEVLRSWRDPATLVARPLTRDLLKELVKEGYVLRESSLRERRAKTASSARRRRRRKLFGTIPVSRPRRRLRRRKGKRALRLPGERVERVLLMRVRKASPTERPTQTQIPIAVYNDGFFSGIDAIVSARDGRSHGVRPAYARGSVNTLKFEIPEMRDYDDPVVRFERGPSGITYEAYDATSPGGRPILRELEHGRTVSPPQTVLTRPANPRNSTWWRFTQATG